MAIYTFYLCNLDGGSNSFEAFELGDDKSAPEHALKLLGEHPSCAYVAVWEGDRPVMERHRAAAFNRDQTASGSSLAS